MATSSSSPLTFTLLNEAECSSRVGLLSFTRPSDGTHLEIETPGLILNLERGVLPYISTDNKQRSNLPSFAHTSLDTTLHLPTPLSTLLPCSSTPHPLHKHLLLPPRSTLLSLSLSNPSSHLLSQPYQNNLISAITSNGFKNVAPKTYYDSALALKPDIIWAAADTRGGISGKGDAQVGAGKNEGKRAESKGVEKSLRWLGELVEAAAAKSESGSTPVLWQELVGGSDPFARKAFVEGLLAPSSDPNTSTTSSLDSHLSGYTLPLPTLRARLCPSTITPPSVLTLPSSSHHPLPSSSFLPLLTPLLQPSLSLLPQTKPRYAPAALSPHEILGLVGDLGVDLFDATLAHEATEMGVALEFQFPLPEGWEVGEEKKEVEVGINLYDAKWEMCFEPLSDGGVRSLASNGGKGEREVGESLVHCSVSAKEKVVGEGEEGEPLTRAYVHHLLMAHELLASILLQSHNIAHLQAFLASIRSTLLLGQSVFDHERARFERYYSGEMGVLMEAKKLRLGVKKERGKGSMGKDRSGKVGDGEGSGSD